MTKDIKTAIGLMSGTSIDGIDVSLIKSDGNKVKDERLNKYYPYDKTTKKKLKKIIDNEFHSLNDIKTTEKYITQKHVDAVNNFIAINNLKKSDIDVIGFSGHTILHNPENSITWQIGNAHLLAIETGINVVSDFRTKDVALKGQGAPLVPIYHHNLLKKYPKKPLIILNIGGVSNITYLQDDNENNVISCDICFGNAPMDDLIQKTSNASFDENGKIANKGEVNNELANAILSQEYFSKKAPKSLDRNHFHELLNKHLISDFSHIKIEDSLKTICFIIAKSLQLIIEYFKKKPEEIIVCGGGRKNKTLMKIIEDICKIEVKNMDDLYHDGDFIESQAFAFLAIRHLNNLPITFRKTTGVLLEKHNAPTLKEPHSSSCGGVFYHA